MPLGLLLVLAILHGAHQQYERKAVALRQVELESAIFNNDAIQLETSLQDAADPNHCVALDEGRLKKLGTRNSRLPHFFAEETKATPLALAAALGESRLCASLVKHGAARFTASSWGWVPAQYAARLGYPELAAALIACDPAASHYRIIVRISPQVVILFKDGCPLIRGKISTGKPGYDTPPGRYLVTDKERTRRSSLYKVPMPYFLRLSFSEYGIHQGVNPGRPASHGCIRVGREQVAKTIFEQTPIGTLVTIR